MVRPYIGTRTRCGKGADRGKSPPTIEVLTVRGAILVRKGDGREGADLAVECLAGLRSGRAFAAALVGTRSTRLKSILQLAKADWKAFCLPTSCKMRWDGTGQAKEEQ